jgi:tRNA pseudouridine-54 N-methylase
MIPQFLLYSKTISFSGRGMKTINNNKTSMITLIQKSLETAKLQGYLQGSVSPGQYIKKVRLMKLINLNLSLLVFFNVLVPTSILVFSPARVFAIDCSLTL